MYPAPPRLREDNFPDTIPYSLFLELVVTDPEVITELWAKQEGRERDEYALGALRLGILALRQARGQIDAGANTLPRDEQPVLSAAHSYAAEDTPEEGEESLPGPEPVAEEHEDAVVADYGAATVPSSYWLRRRRRRSRFTR